ncbi:MAG: hypothetical protein P0S93_05565 [Candidatus Neptunochlamydia sp.]|nr:hypothetical protein [Candidatus Neptunochlamydia sp.]
MSLQLVSGLANTGLGAVYWNIAPKFSLLNKIPLKIQMSAFALATIAQGILTMHCFPSQESEGFSKRKTLDVVAPYLLISGSIYFFHRQALKANIMSSAVLGTVQLGVSWLSPNIVAALAFMFPKKFIPEEIAFGKDDWAKYFGEVGEVPPIPKGMAEALESPCPFHPLKQMGDTHILVLIPQTVNDKPFTLNLLYQLLCNNKAKNPLGFARYSTSIQKGLGKNAIRLPYWVLMTKDVIPNSRSKSYKEQITLVRDKGKGFYDIPSAVEVAASIVMHYLKTGEVLYGTKPLTYTRCKEILKRGNPMAVGAFSSFKELEVVEGNTSPTTTANGMAAIRRFCADSWNQDTSIPIVLNNHSMKELIAAFVVLKDHF